MAGAPAVATHWQGRVRDAVLATGALVLAGLIVAAAVQPADEPATPIAALERLRRDPLDLTALRVQGLAAERAGRPASAAAILNFVGTRSWRDGPTDGWLLTQRLREGDIHDAFAYADALLRLDADGVARPLLFNLFARSAEYVEARPELEARLAVAPWWRTAFLQHLAIHGDVPGATEVFAALAAGPAPATPTEYAALIERLVAAHEDRAALDAWIRIAQAGRLAMDEPHDGDFAMTWDHTPFTWSPASGDGATSEARESPDGPVARALRVDYDGYASPTLPAQLLVLAPGAYHLGWLERSDAGADQRMFWRVRCAASGQVLAGAPRADAAAAAPAWRATNLDFVVPAAGCGGQWLELTAAPGERRGAFAAWYGDFRVKAAAPAKAGT